MPGKIHHDRVGKATAYDVASKKYTVEYTSNAKSTESEEFAEKNVKGLSHLVKQYLLESLNHDPATQEKVRNKLQSIAPAILIHWDRKLELKDNLVPNEEGNLVVNHTLVNEAIDTKIKEVFDDFKTFHQSIGGNEGDEWVKECGVQIDAFFANAIIRLYGWKKELGDQLTLEELNQKAAAIGSKIGNGKYPGRQSINLTPALQKAYNEIREDLINPKKPMQHIGRRDAILKFVETEPTTPKTKADILAHVRSDARLSGISDLETKIDSDLRHFVVKEGTLVSVGKAKGKDRGWIIREHEAEGKAFFEKKQKVGKGAQKKEERGKKPMAATFTAAAAAAVVAAAAEDAKQSQLVDNGAATSPVTAGRPPSPSLGGGGGGGGAKRAVGENAESPSGKKPKCDGVKQDAAFPAAAAAASPPSSHQQASGSFAAQQMVVSVGFEEVVSQRSRTIAAAPNTALASSSTTAKQPPQSPQSLDAGGTVAAPAATKRKATTPKASKAATPAKTNAAPTGDGGSAAQPPRKQINIKKLDAPKKTAQGADFLDVSWPITEEMAAWKAQDSKNHMYKITLTNADNASDKQEYNVHGNSYRFRNLVPGNKYKALVELVDEEGDTGVKSKKWSHAYEIKDSRSPVSAECKRKMWARTYVSKENPEFGLMSYFACLGCLARGKTAADANKLNPACDESVHAAHIIAYAEGGPDGTKEEHAWNFLPLCPECNHNMKTTHLIDWFYAECKPGSKKVHTFRILREVFQRLHRAAECDDGFKIGEWGGRETSHATLACIKGLYHTGERRCEGHAIDTDRKFQKWTVSKKMGGKKANYTTKDSFLQAALLAAVEQLNSKTIDERDASVENASKFPLLLEEVVQSANFNMDAWQEISDGVTNFLKKHGK